VKVARHALISEPSAPSPSRTRARNARCRRRRRGPSSPSSPPSASRSPSPSTPAAPRLPSSRSRARVSQHPTLVLGTYSRTFKPQVHRRRSIAAPLKLYFKAAEPPSPTGRESYFQIVEEYPKGSKEVFSIPMRPHFTRDQTETSAGGRASLGDLPWNVIVIYKDKFTVTGINSAMRAHLRFGHISLHSLHSEQGNPDWQRSQCYCSCCQLTKAKRILNVPRNPKRHRVIQSLKQGGIS